ncbi:MAG: NAD-dependent epimerase/dehydratase family protein [Bacteroidetes bacterium]|nr:NAD-dependent epimerase/dehydratase family protein [Bacteroidota bacterium]
MNLVTGGTGLVGSHLLLELARKNIPVRAIFRDPEKIELARKVFEAYEDPGMELFGRIQWVKGDILDVPSLEDAMVDVDHVYHAAGVVSFHPKGRAMMMKINVEGTANVVNVALAGNVKKLCHVSSIAALGRAENDGMVDEHTEWKTSRENSYYAISKYGAEREVWRGMEEGLDANIVNPSIILGFAQPDQGSTQMFETAWNGLKYYTLGVNGYVDARDVSRAMRLLMESDIRNERFILNAANLTYQELFNIMADVMGKKRPSIKVNKFMSEVSWRAEKVKSLITGKSPLITRETARTAMTTYRYSSDKICERIGFEFTDIDQTIRELYQLFKKYYFK